MKVIFVDDNNLQQLYKESEQCVVALGFFDGVHIGHQQVIQTAKEKADKLGVKLAVMSFHPHPLSVITKGKKVIPLLSSLSEKKQLLQQLGVDLFYLVEFTNIFSALSPEAFVEHYLVQLKVRHAVAGFDFSFGRKGTGHLANIPAYSNEKIEVTEVPCVDYLGEKISSTAIRERLHQSEVHEIPHFLGRHYMTNGFFNGTKFKVIVGKMIPCPGKYEVLLEMGDDNIHTSVCIEECGCIKSESPIRNKKGFVQIHWIQPLASKSVATS